MMKLTKNPLGIYELVDTEQKTAPFLMLDLTDLIETYNLIQEELKNVGVLAP